MLRNHSTLQLLLSAFRRVCLSQNCARVLVKYAIGTKTYSVQVLILAFSRQAPKRLPEEIIGKIFP